MLPELSTASTPARQTSEGVPPPLPASAPQVGPLLGEPELLTLALNQHASVAITDRSGRITYANDKFCQISGYSRAELIGQDHRLLNSGFHSRAFFDAMYLTITQGEVWQGDLCNRAKDGRLYWVKTTIVPFKDQSGQVTQYVAIRVVITEQQLAYDRLSQSEAQLQTTMDCLEEGVIVSDLAGAILQFNHAARNMHGFSAPDEWERRLPEFIDIFEYSDLEGAVCPLDQWPLARVLRGETLSGLEVGIRRVRSDWKRVFRYGGALVHDAGGQELMAVLTIRDITQERRSADLVLQLNANLEQRVAERTEQLTAANAELESFSYSVSHDLRAPLRSLDGFSQALIEDCGPKLDAEDRDNLARIRSASQRMGRLIDDLLKLSHLTRVDLNLQVVDLSELARAVADDLAAREPLRRVNFVIAPGLETLADAWLMRVALENLLGNAWKFSGKRPEARIEFGAERNDGEPVFFVRDDGIGFDMTHAGKLFGAFQRLHATKDFPGTGIGLATVQRIIHRHGGRIWAEGSADAGATFRFTLQSAP